MGHAEAAGRKQGAAPAPDGGSVTFVILQKPKSVDVAVFISTEPGEEQKQMVEFLRAVKR
jgi:hypothetical protein